MFDPKTNKFPYPEDTGCHYLGVEKKFDNTYDDKYQYVQTSNSYKVKNFFSRLLCGITIFPFQRIRMGFRVEGRENLKKYKEEIKKGVISVSNHVHMWDYVAVMNALKPRRTNILVWDQNISGPNGKLIRLVGGIPVPINSMTGFAKMCHETIDLVKNGGWLHIAAEGTMWEFYAPIRPFKEGAAFFAYRANRPIIPMAFSFREVSGIRKKIFHQIAKITMHIGEPLYPNMDLPKQESIIDLTKRLHAKVCELAGYKEGENIYSPVYNAETCRRIDYYTNEYGVGYKGSW